MQILSEPSSSKTETPLTQKTPHIRKIPKPYVQTILELYNEEKVLKAKATETMQASETIQASSPKSGERRKFRWTPRAGPRPAHSKKRKSVCASPSCHVVVPLAILLARHKKDVATKKTETSISIGWCFKSRLEAVSRTNMKLGGLNLYLSCFLQRFSCLGTIVQLQRGEIEVLCFITLASVANSFQHRFSGTACHTALRPPQSRQDCIVLSNTAGRQRSSERQNARHGSRILEPRANELPDQTQCQDQDGLCWPQASLLPCAYGFFCCFVYRVSRV